MIERRLGVGWKLNHLRLIFRFGGINALLKTSRFALGLLNLSPLGTAYPCSRHLADPGRFPQVQEELPNRGLGDAAADDDDDDATWLLLRPIETCCSISLACLWKIDCIITIIITKELSWCLNWVLVLFDDMMIWYINGEGFGGFDFLCLFRCDVKIRRHGLWWTRKQQAGKEYKNRKYIYIYIYI